MKLREPGHRCRPDFRHRPSLRGAHVKKLVLLALIGVGVLAVWRKVQADRAELDLWTEATTSDN
jgi:hypothetical protein